MISYEEQVKRYKHLVPIGVKSGGELIALLQSRYQVEEVPEAELMPHIPEMYKFNAFHCLCNEKLNVPVEEMVMRYFEVITATEDPLAQIYPRILYGKYVVLEEKTGYFESSDNRLFMELELAQGVSQEDFDNETMAFREVLAHIALNFDRGAPYITQLLQMPRE